MEELKAWNVLAQKYAELVEMLSDLSIESYKDFESVDEALDLVTNIKTTLQELQYVGEEVREVIDTVESLLGQKIS